jgi:hypothetical protein
MAKLEVVDGRVEVRLSTLERIGALRGDVSVPVGAVLDVRTSGYPFGELRGIRAPGTGFPKVIALGTWRRRGGKDFVAVYQGQSAVVVEVLPGSEFDRLIVGIDDPKAVAENLRAAISDLA